MSRPTGNQSSSRSRLQSILIWVAILTSLAGTAAAQETRVPAEPAGASLATSAIAQATATEIALAMGVPAADLVSASILTTDPRAAGVSTGALGSYFPNQGATFGLLATGLVTTAGQPNNSQSTSTVLNGLDNSQGNDLAQLRLTLRPPNGATCVQFDFAFYSEEFPEFVGSQYNDAFTAEIGGTDLQIVNNQVIAPLNFAFDTAGNPISVNTVFGVSGNTGTTYDGATPLLRARSPLEPSAFPTVDLYFSVQDLGDSIYDSAVFLDNFQWLFGPNCTAGSEPLPDSDGDGLLDEWEANGIDVDGNGTIDLDLPAMGADPQHKDIFVETDYMVDPGFCLFGFCLGGHSHKPKADALQKVIDAFERAPVPNPDGTTGIHLHIDAGPETIMNPVTGALWGTLSQSDDLAHDSELGVCEQVVQGGCRGIYNWTEFDAIKGVGSTTGHFSVFRRDVFHYVVFAHQLGASSTSGISRGISASDFIVSLGSWTASVGSSNEQGGTLMHELGHNLSLRHGGGTDDNYKPNYLSVMNYFFQTRGLRKNNVDATFDYSFIDIPDLVEGHLNETVGLNGGTAINDYGTRFYCLHGATIPTSCSVVSSSPSLLECIVNNANGHINWDCDDNSDDPDVPSNVNNEGGLTTLAGFDDWDNVRFDGGAVGKLGQNVELPEETPSIDISESEDSSLLRTLDVTVEGPGELTLLQGVPQVLEFTATNRGTAGDSYVIEGGSTKGWADFSAVPAAFALGPGQSRTFGVVETPPSSTVGGTVELLSVTARSLTNPALSDSATARILAATNPPVANAGVDQTVECAQHDGTSVVLDGTASHAESQRPLSFRWTGPFPEGGGVIDGPSPTVTLPLGDSTITLRVNDGIVDSYPDEMVARVLDTTPPTVIVDSAPNYLWPPNHKMYAIHTGVLVHDACDPSPTLALNSVASSEPDDSTGGGDGSTTNDIQDASIGTADVDILLRAERQGSGPGRTYTIRYQGTDASGNVGVGTDTVNVPHDQDGIEEPLTLKVDGAASTGVNWEPVYQAQHFDVIRGSLDQLRVDGSNLNLGSVVCLATNRTSNDTVGAEDAESPEPGKAFFYLVQFYDGAAESSYGEPSAPKARVVGAGSQNCH